MGGRGLGSGFGLEDAIAEQREQDGRHDGRDDEEYEGGDHLRSFLSAVIVGAARSGAYDRPDTGSMEKRFPEVTRFGAPARPVAAAAGVLRARASASGVELRPASQVDLMAAAVVLDAWSALLGGAGLDSVGLHSGEATRVAAAGIARAAGHPGETVVLPPEDCADSQDLLRLAEEHLAWARELCPDATGLVLMRAGSDLSAAGPDSRFTAFGVLLQMLAESEF